MNKIKSLLEKNYIKKIILFLSISLFLEIFVFNFRFYESLFYKNNLNLSVTSYNGMVKTGNNTYKITNESNYIVIDNIYKKINNLYLDLESLDNVVEYKLYAKDTGNKIYYRLPKRTITNNIENSKYVKLNLSGNAHKLKIRFKLYKDNDFLKFKNEIKINGFTANVVKPFAFNYLRFFILFISLCFIYFIRPRSSLYKFKLITNEKYNKKFNYILITSFIIFNIFLFYNLSKINNYFNNPTGFNQLEYNELANSFKNKRVDIDYKVSDSLKNLKNPYDTNYRERILLEENEKYLWDYAFYNNKYYVYFGVVPVVIAYFPYYLITNNDLKNSTYIFIFGVFILLTLLLLLKELCKKYFKNISTLSFLLITSLMINGSYLLYALKRPDLYNVPIVSAIFFSILGLYLWLKSTSYGKLNLKLVFLGSFSMALVAGCRPQLLLTSLFCIPIFKDYLKEKELLKKLMVFAIPFALVGLALMYYNYIRFSSPFDFGANYNLTTNDMTLRGFNIDRVFLGIYYMLFKSPDISLVFPFINKIFVDTQYMGVTISEPLFGGLIACNLILIVGLFVKKFKNLINNPNVYTLTIMCNIIAVVLVILDTQMAGILPRYMLDFSWLLFLATAICLLALFNNIDKFNDKEKYYINLVFIILFLSSTVFNYFLIPVDLNYSLKYYNSTVYQQLSNMIQFWL